MPLTLSHIFCGALLFLLAMPAHSQRHYAEDDRATVLDNPDSLPWILGGLELFSHESRSERLSLGQKAFVRMELGTRGVVWLEHRRVTAMGYDVAYMALFGRSPVMNIEDTPLLRIH